MGWSPRCSCCCDTADAAFDVAGRRVAWDLAKGPCYTGDALNSVQTPQAKILLDLTGPVDVWPETANRVFPAYLLLVPSRLDREFEASEAALVALAEGTGQRTCLAVQQQR